VASTSKVFSMGHINQLTWVPAANIPSPLKWKFEILPPVYRNDHHHHHHPRISSRRKSWNKTSGPLSIVYERTITRRSLWIRPCHVLFQLHK